MTLTLKPLCAGCDGSGWIRDQLDPAGRGQLECCQVCKRRIVERSLYEIKPLSGAAWAATAERVRTVRDGMHWRTSTMADAFGVNPRQARRWVQYGHPPPNIADWMREAERFLQEHPIPTPPAEPTGDES